MKLVRLPMRKMTSGASENPPAQAGQGFREFKNPGSSVPELRLATADATKMASDFHRKTAKPQINQGLGGGRVVQKRCHVPARKPATHRTVTLSPAADFECCGKCRLCRNLAPVGGRWGRWTSQCFPATSASKWSKPLTAPNVMSFRAVLEQNLEIGGHLEVKTESVPILSREEPCFQSKKQEFPYYDFTFSVMTFANRTARETRGKSGICSWIYRCIMIFYHFRDSL